MYSFRTFSLEFKYRNAVRRERISDGIRLAVAFLFYRFVYERTGRARTAVLLVVAVEHQFELFSPGHAHAVIRALHRCEVAHEQQVFLIILRMTLEAVNAAENV